jgi:hypothetical protein
MALQLGRLDTLQARTTATSALILPWMLPMVVLRHGMSAVMGEQSRRS